MSSPHKGRAEESALALSHLALTTSVPTASLVHLSRLYPSHSFTQYRARRLGLPAPSLNPFVRRDRNRNAYEAPTAEPSGIKSFFSKTVNSIKNIGSGGGRSTTGGYESTGRDRRGFGPLDPDEAWDSRVGNEYYEEQELGLQDPQQGPYGGSGYGNVVGAEVDGGRGRSKSRQRELDDRYDEEMGLGAPSNKNPFGDDAAMRGVSPRPMIDTKKSHQSQKSLDVDNSPSERRSMFRENM